MSRKNPHVVKAGLISKATAAKGKLFSVVATLSSTDNFNAKEFVLAKYGCKNCKTEFAAVKGSEPFCVVCSDTKVHEIESSTKIEKLSKIPEANLASVHCGGCKSHNVITMETAHLLDTKMHCVTCGTEIEYKLDSDDDLENEEIITDDNSLTDADDIIPDEETEVSENEESELETEEAELNDNPQIGSETPESTPAKIDTAIEPKKVDLPKVENQDKTSTETSQTEITDDGVGTGNIDLPDSEEFDLIDVVEGQLEVSRVADTIIISKSGVPVATLEKANAHPEHAERFHSRSLVEAIKFTTTQNGAKALASFNFINTKVKLPVPKIIESKVSEQITASTKILEDKAKSYGEDFQQCIAIASVGLNKNFWPKKQNVLKASFIENLKNVGVRNPEEMVSRIFAQHGEDYHRTLIETANHLLTKSVEARNELAETLGEVNPIDDSDEYDESSELEARLETASFKTKKSVSPEIVTSNVQELVSNLRAIRSNGKLF